MTLTEAGREMAVRVQEARTPLLGWGRGLLEPPPRVLRRVPDHF
ncbi:hypothetical protein [Nonomuraea deserti]|nr:hypothetical protein [Nonomuraea deserti]